MMPPPCAFTALPAVSLNAIPGGSGGEMSVAVTGSEKVAMREPGAEPEDPHPPQPRNTLPAAPAGAPSARGATAAARRARQAVAGRAVAGRAVAGRAVARRAAAAADRAARPGVSPRACNVARRTGLAARHHGRAGEGENPR